MTLHEIVEKLGFKVLVGEEQLNQETHGGYAADLLSCVMAGAKPQAVWVTLQTHVNIVAVAALNELACIVVAEHAVVPQATLDKAIQQDVVILSSPEPVYETVGRLIALGV